MKGIITVDGLRRGQLVRSIAGRDQAQLYLIYNLVGEHFVEVVDGKKHPVTKPKKKNVKHVRITLSVATDIETAINQGQIISNTAVLTAIHRLQKQLEEGERFHG
jgi:ribosomal protein L14E/L6E/L27E